MTIESTLVLVLVALVTGALIGAIGIGGVLLVPALVLVGGLDITVATPVATASFLFTGIAGTVSYQRARRISWDTTRWLIWASVPGAIAGAVTNIALPGPAITMVVAAMLGAAAIQALIGVSGDPDGRRTLGVVALCSIGFAVGFGSTLSGTGGPVLLIPVMLLAGTAVGVAVAASQPIQIPIAVFGTASFLFYGELDWRLAIILGLVQAVGSVVGARFSAALPTGALRLAVGWALAASAVVLAVRAVAA